MYSLIYWIKFDKMLQPEKIVVKDFLQLMDEIKRLVEYHQQPFEWLIRDYR